MTLRLSVNPLQPDAGIIAQAAACLRAGGLVAFPTETVYGLGAHALDPDAVARIYMAKERPATDPLIVHIPSLEQLAPLVTAVPPEVVALAQRFWPGPLTLVLPRHSRVPDAVTAGGPTVAVRVPTHPVARALLDAAALPVAAPSANRFSHPSPTRAEHVLQDLEGRIDLVLDAGPTPIGIESTVLDLTSTPPRVLRPGAVTLADIQTILPEAVSGTGVEHGGGAARSPGLLDRHYAPRAPLTVYDGAARDARMRADAERARAAGERLGVLVDTDATALWRTRADVVIALGPTGDETAAASRLYAALRELDDAGVTRILACAPPERGGLSTALRDRLRRAASGQVIHT